MTDSQLRQMIRTLELELLRRWHERARQDRTHEQGLSDTRKDKG